MPGINNWAHGGGMATGAILAYLLGYQEQRRETGGHKRLAIICLAGTALVLAWAALNSLLYLLLA